MSWCKCRVLLVQQSLILIVGVCDLVDWWHLFSSQTVVEQIKSQMNIAARVIYFILRMNRFIMYYTHNTYFTYYVASLVRMPRYINDVYGYLTRTSNISINLYSFRNISKLKSKYIHVCIHRLTSLYLLKSKSRKTTSFVTIWY